jgi:hypothetical protein
MAWTKTQEREFVQVLFALGEIFNEPVSTIRGEMFLRLVEDWPFEAIKRAATQHGRTATFFPKPGELRALAVGNVDDAAEQAWMALLGEVRRVGHWGTPTWPNDATQRTVEGMFGSWQGCCQHLPADGPELLGVRKQFLAAFGATWRQQEQAQLGPSREEAKTLLTGLQERAAPRAIAAPIARSGLEPRRTRG